MKTVYLVRHGQTPSNINQVFTPPDEPLSEIGLQQAQKVAARFTHEKVDRIISSSYPRARQTAAAIESALGLVPTYSDLFVETRAPNDIYGKSLTDPGTDALRELLDQHWGDASWRHSDEENFFDASQRVRQALACLEQQPEEHILVVSHANFLRLTLFAVLLGDQLTPEITASMRKTSIMSNTGVTVLELDDRNRWKLVRWNDTVHLGTEQELPAS